MPAVTVYGAVFFLDKLFRLNCWSSTEQAINIAEKQSSPTPLSKKRKREELDSLPTIDGVITLSDDPRPINQSERNYSNNELLLNELSNQLIKDAPLGFASMYAGALLDNKSNTSRFLNNLMGNFNSSNSNLNSINVEQQHNQNYSNSLQESVLIPAKVTEDNESGTDDFIQNLINYLGEDSSNIYNAISDAAEERYDLLYRQDEQTQSITNSANNTDPSPSIFSSAITVFGSVNKNSVQQSNDQPKVVNLVKNP